MAARGKDVAFRLVRTPLLLWATGGVHLLVSPCMSTRGWGTPCISTVLRFPNRGMTGNHPVFPFCRKRLLGRAVGGGTDFLVPPCRKGWVVGGGGGGITVFPPSCKRQWRPVVHAR